MRYARYIVHVSISRVTVFKLASSRGRCYGNANSWSYWYSTSQQDNYFEIAKVSVWILADILTYLTLTLILKQCFLFPFAMLIKETSTSSPWRWDDSDGHPCCHVTTLQKNSTYPALDAGSPKDSRCGTGRPEIDASTAFAKGFSISGTFIDWDLIFVAPLSLQNL